MTKISTIKKSLMGAFATVMLVVFGVAGSSAYAAVPAVTLPPAQSGVTGLVSMAAAGFTAALLAAALGGTIYYAYSLTKGRDINAE